MRILVIAESIAPSTGGARVGILGLCRSLVNRGHKVTLFATNADGMNSLDVPVEVSTLHEGVEIYYFSVLFSFMGNHFSLSMNNAVKRNITQYDIVLIHSLYRFTSTAAAYYCRKYRVPYILRPHGTLDPYLVYRRRSLLKWAYINIFEKKNFKYAAAIQFSCQMEERIARSFIPNASSRIIIEEGIDICDFSILPAYGKFRTKHSEATNKVLVLFLGRFHQKKGLELLLDAFNLVTKSCSNAHLVLAGSGDEVYTDQIRHYLNDKGLSNCSTITGQLNDSEKLAVLADSDLFVLPSYGENFGIAVVEAMACGLPVLISDKVGICKYVADFDAGLVTPCEASKIADGMVKLINDPVLRNTLGLNGKMLVESHFNINRMAERMEMEYQSLCIND